MFGLFWAGCARHEGDPPVEPPGPATADTAAATGDSGTPPPLDVSGVVTAVELALEVAAASPAECAFRYDVALAAAAGQACPRFFQRGNPTSWDSGCVTQEGAEFRGLISRWNNLDAFAEETLRPAIDAHADLAPGGVAGVLSVSRAVGIDGSARVDFKDQSWMLAGELFDVVGADGELRFAHHTVRGVCEASTPLGTPWTDLELPLWLEVTGLQGPAGRWFAVEGSVSDLPGDFDTVTFLDVELGSACDLEPTGTIEVRAFGGERTSLVWGDDCDGCAAVEGAEVCVDFSAWRHLVPEDLP